MGSSTGECKNLSAWGPSMKSNYSAATVSRTLSTARATRSEALAGKGWRQGVQVLPTAVIIRQTQKPHLVMNCV